MTRRHYYRQPTPRRKQEVPSSASVVLFCFLMVAILFGALWYGYNHEVPTEAERREAEKLIKHDSLAPTYTHDGETIRWYVFIDPDSNLQYLVNDRGGCCPRIGRDGIQMGLTITTLD